MTASEYSGWLLAHGYSAQHLAEFKATIEYLTPLEWARTHATLSAPGDLVEALAGVDMAIASLSEATAQSVSVDDLPSSFNQGQV